MNQKRFWITAMVGLLFVHASVISADQIRWKFKAGDRYEISIDQSSTMKSTVNRTVVDVKLELGSEMRWEVLSIKENGNAVIKQVYTRMKVKVTKTAKPTIVYDTANKEDVPKNAKNFAEVYDKVIDIPFEVEMTERGEIVSVNLENKDKETIREIPESMEARQLFEKRGIMKLLNGGGFILPKDEIETGFQWPVKKTQKMSFGTADYESIFTYQGTDAASGVAKFAVKATAKLKDQPKNPLEKPLVLKTQNQTGEIAFDTRGGFLKSNQVRQEMATEKPFREMTIKTESVVENKLNVVKK